ncbi:histidine phosphatase family protein [Streptomyces griseosporeus]|uniref:histidine phosphatase family protein n=1 Tax=Streptomyces griseosporeus TaxID=1910 RepID=UPI00167EDDE8|nr:histidine phosphatase family protein [Streptomyces griseosporeus]
MTSRVMLISPGMNAALREARFDDGRPLDEAALRAARAASGALPAAQAVWCSPTVRCEQTARALGLAAVPVPALAGLDAGRWRGATLAEVTAAEPEALAAWLADPEAAPHGGESVRALCDRVEDWLATAADTDGRTLAVVEPEVVRAAVVRTLGAADTAFWRTDVPPLSAVEFTGRAGRRNVKVGRPLV